jgi:uncharacterized protein
LAVIVALQLPLAGHLVPGESFGAQLGREGVYWLLLAVIVTFVLRIERRPLASVGLTAPGWRGIVLGLLAAAVTVAGALFIYAIVFPALGLSPSEAGMQALHETPVWFRVALILRAACFEELFYRGFMIERLQELTGSKLVAGGISLAAFTYAHLSFWGWAHLLIVAFAGAILTCVYLWKRNLVITFVAHFATDAVGLLAT